MERKVGEIFTYNGKIYQVIKSNACIDCAFRERVCSLLKSGSIGPCTPNIRSDKTNVIFKEVKKYMEIKNNQLTIDIPEGMEIDLKNSNLANGIVKFRKKEITYDDILQAYATDFGGIRVPTHCIDKILAISQLMNIAKHYNGNWKPDWSNNEELKYYIVFDHYYNIYRVKDRAKMSGNIIYFAHEEDAQAVIDNPNFKDILNAVYKN